jgi:hypothetical protein
LVQQGEYVKADPLPADLAKAADDVANALGLPANWLNAGPTSIVDTGFPEGFASRVEVRRYEGLVLNIASRYDLSRPGSGGESGAWNQAASLAS